MDDDSRLEDGKILTRFVLPPMCIAYSPGGKHVTAGGDDDTIKMIDVEKAKVFKTINTGPYVRGISYDPESEFLAVTTADGTFTVYDIASGDVKLSKKKAATKLDPMAPYRSEPDWHPDGGNLVAVPSQDGSVALYERLSWDLVDELSGEHQAGVHLLRFSKNGIYLASTAADQSVVVWDVAQKSLVAKKVLPGAASGMEWHPSENQLTLVTEDGQIVSWKDPVPASLRSPTDEVDAKIEQGRNLSSHMIGTSA